MTPRERRGKVNPIWRQERGRKEIPQHYSNLTAPFSSYVSHFWHSMCVFCNVTLTHRHTLLNAKRKLLVAVNIPPVEAASASDGVRGRWRLTFKWICSTQSDCQSDALSKECVRTIQDWAEASWLRTRWLSCVHALGWITGVEAVPVGLAANIRTMPASLLRHNRWSRLTGKSGINHGICFGERLPFCLKSLSSASDTSSFPLSPGYLSLPGGARGEGSSTAILAQPDTNPVCYRRGFACSDIGTSGKGRAKWGVSVKEYPLSKALIAESTYDKEWRCQERRGCFWASAANRCLQSFSWRRPGLRQIDLWTGFCIVEPVGRRHIVVLTYAIMML